MTDAPIGLDMLSQCERLNMKRWQTKQHCPPCLPRQGHADHIRAKNLEAQKRAQAENIALLKRVTDGLTEWRVNEIAEAMEMTPESARTIHDRLFARNVLDFRKDGWRNIWRWK